MIVKTRQFIVAEREAWVCDFYGLSSDDKPSGHLNGSRFVEIDTGKEFLYDEDSDAWYLQAGGGGGVGIDITIGWKAGTTPDVTKIPAGVQVTYQGTTYTGTKVAGENTKGQIVLISIVDGTQPNLFNEYVTYQDGNTFGWEMIGTTEVNLDGYARQVVVAASANKTVNGYQVPKLTDAQLLALYNGVVAGDSVVVTDATGKMHFEGINADMISDELFITFRYFDKMILEYAENNVTNFYPLISPATMTLYEVGSDTPVSFKIYAEGV